MGIYSFKFKMRRVNRKKPRRVRYKTIPVLTVETFVETAIDVDATPTEGYEVSVLRDLPSEYLLGDRETPGPLVRLAYPEVMRQREVSSKFKNIIDTDYFWELKTRRDFGVEEEYQEVESWKTQYLLRAQAYGLELLLASKEGNEVQVQRLLDLGVNPNFRDESGNTALMVASHWGYLQVLEVLLAAGAEVDMQNEYGHTALMHASEHGHPEVVDRLLAAGAEVNARDERRATALMMASDYGKIEVVERLLAARAEVNAHDVEGYDALGLVTMSLPPSADELVDLLIDAGADVDWV